MLDNNNLNMHAYKHSTCTFYIAPDPGASANCEVKSCVLEDTIIMVWTSKGSLEAKFGFLIHHFQMSIIKTGMQKYAANFLKPDSSIFTMWSYCDLCTNDYAVVVPSARPTFPNDACYIWFNIIVNPATIMQDINTALV